MTKWISVEDRMPEYGEKMMLSYIAHWISNDGENKTGKPHVCVGRRTHTDKIGEHYDLKDIGAKGISHKADGYFEDRQVTHWKPLPDPPEVMK